MTCCPLRPPLPPHPAYVGGTSQEGIKPKNWEFYPLRIGFS